MKKILGILLCVVLVCFSLVGCKETIIGEDLKYRDDSSNDNAGIETLNMYVVVGDGTASGAIDSVILNINAYLKETYQLQLNLVYCTESEYNDKVLASVADDVPESERADIVLINDISLFESLYSQNKLACLTGFYSDKKYQKLNAIIEDNLLASSVIKELAPNQENVATDALKYDYNYYTVPNNHAIGEYEYIVINKEQARDVKYYSSSKIAAMNRAEDISIYEDAIGVGYVELCSGSYATKFLLEYGCETAQELENKIGAYYDSLDDAIKSEKTKEEYINEYSQIIEKDGEHYVKAPIKKVNFVNVASYPNATKTEAFSSAFAVIRSLDDVGTLDDEQKDIIKAYYSKRMDIIYALNTDVELMNMLQYGYVGTNYKFIKDNKNQNTNYIELETKDPTVIYNMNLSYTGNPYIAYYCDSIGWNSEIHNNILKQNADSYTLQEKVDAESALLSIENIDFAFCEKVVLPFNGVTFGDVTIEWSSPSSCLKFKGERTSDIFNDVYMYIDYTEDGTPLDTTLIATLTCVDASGEKAVATKTFNVNVNYTNEQKVEHEAATFTFDKVLTFNEAITLYKNGKLHNDVNIAWATDDERVSLVVDDKNNCKITVTPSDDGNSFSVLLKATFECEGIAQTVEYNVIIYSLQDEVDMVLESIVFETDTLSFGDALSLLTKVDNHNAIKITWKETSDNVEIDKSGVLKVSEPKDGQAYNFELTVTITKNVGEGDNKATATATKTYVFEVIAPSNEA